MKRLAGVVELNKLTTHERIGSTDASLIEGGKSQKLHLSNGLAILAPRHMITLPFYGNVANSCKAPLPQAIAQTLP
jgi:hypothetical protein